MNSEPGISLLFERDLVRKPVPTFRDHALTAHPHALQAPSKWCCNANGPIAAIGIGIRIAIIAEAVSAKTTSAPSAISTMPPAAAPSAVTAARVHIARHCRDDNRGNRNQAKHYIMEFMEHVPLPAMMRARLLLPHCFMNPA